MTVTFTNVPVAGAGPALLLDEVNHRAYLDGRELVRVTTALSEIGLIDARWFTEESRLRGIYVHDAVKLYHEGVLAEGSIDPQLDPYWTGYRLFLAESGFTPRSVEQPIWDELYGYAGRYDLWGQFERLPPSATDLIDIKTGQAPKWVKLQTMLYRRRLVFESGAPVHRVRRWALELPGEGRYRLLSLNLVPGTQQIDRDADRRHECVGLAAITLANYKRGLIK